MYTVQRHWGVAVYVLQERIPLALLVAVNFVGSKNFPIPKASDKESLHKADWKQVFWVSTFTHRRFPKTFNLHLDSTQPFFFWSYE